MAERFLVVDRMVDGQVRELFSTDVGQLPVELLEEEDHLHVRIGEAVEDDEDSDEDDDEAESEGDTPKRRSRRKTT